MNSQLIDTKGKPQCVGFVQICMKQILKRQFRYHYNLCQYNEAIDVLTRLKDEILPIDKDDESGKSLLRKIENKMLNCYYRLAKSEWAKGDFIKSLVYWKTINTINSSKSAAAHYYEGICHWLNDDVQNALICVHNACDIAPQVDKYREFANSLLFQ